MEVVGTAAEVMGTAVVVGWAVELPGGAELVLWVLVVTGGCAVGVGAVLTAVVEGGREEVSSRIVVVGKFVMMGARDVSGTTAGTHSRQSLQLSHALQHKL